MSSDANFTEGSSLIKDSVYPNYVSHLIIIAVLSTLLLVILVVLCVLGCSYIWAKRAHIQARFQGISQPNPTFTPRAPEIIEMNEIHGNERPVESFCGSNYGVKPKVAGASAQLGLLNIQEEAQVPTLPAPKTWTPSPPYTLSKMKSGGSPAGNYLKWSHRSKPIHGFCARKSIECNRFCCCSTESPILGHSPAPQRARCLPNQMNTSHCSDKSHHSRICRIRGNHFSPVLGTEYDARSDGCRPRSSLCSTHQTPLQMAKNKENMFNFNNSRNDSCQSVHRCTQTLPDYILPSSSIENPCLQNDNSYASLSWDNLTPDPSLLVNEDLSDVSNCCQAVHCKDEETDVIKLPDSIQ